MYRCYESVFHDWLENALFTNLITIENLAQRILLIRKHKVMLDADLAELYGVTTKRFNEQVKRNLERFPSDSMFQLNDEEHSALRSQIATSNNGRGGRRYAPYVLTEHGAIMAATIPNSPNERLHCSCLCSVSGDAFIAQRVGSQTWIIGTESWKPRPSDCWSYWCD